MNTFRIAMNGAHRRLVEHASFYWRADEIGGKQCCKRILVPTDFSTASKKAIGTALRLAQEYGGSITLLHVVDVSLHTPAVGPANPGALQVRLRAEAERKITDLLSASAIHGIEIKTQILEGIPAREIIWAAQNYDAIVMAKTEERRRFWQIFHRNTVRGVISEASCEVIVIECDTKD